MRAAVFLCRAHHAARSARERAGPPSVRAAPGGRRTVRPAAAPHSAMGLNDSASVARAGCFGPWRTASLRARAGNVTFRRRPAKTRSDLGKTRWLLGKLRSDLVFPRSHLVFTKVPPWFLCRPKAGAAPPQGAVRAPHPGSWRGARVVRVRAFSPGGHRPAAPAPPAPA